MQKTFADGGKITKFVKVFSLESFSLYGIASLTAIASVSDKIDEAYCNYTAESNSYTCKDDSACPTWFYCNTEIGKCQCGEGYHRMIACDEATGRAAVSNCHCVTYDNVTKETHIGSCYYNC